MFVECIYYVSPFESSSMQSVCLVFVRCFSAGLYHWTKMPSGQMCPSKNTWDRPLQPTHRRIGSTLGTSTWAANTLHLDAACCPGIVYLNTFKYKCIWPHVCCQGACCPQGRFSLSQCRIVYFTECQFQWQVSGWFFYLSFPNIELYLFYACWLNCTVTVIFHMIFIYSLNGFNYCTWSFSRLTRRFLVELGTWRKYFVNVMTNVNKQQSTICSFALFDRFTRKSSFLEITRQAHNEPLIGHLYQRIGNFIFELYEELAFTYKSLIRFTFLNPRIRQSVCIMWLTLRPQ